MKKSNKDNAGSILSFKPIQNKTIKSEPFKEINSKELNLSWITLYFVSYIETNCKVLEKFRYCKLTVKLALWGKDSQS